MATPNLSYDNKFGTTLSSGITSTDTTISLTALPASSEGYLVIEPDSSTAWEIIYFLSKTGSAVVCPSVAAGRGVGGSTAQSHSSGATVREDTVAQMFTTLQDATALTGVHQMNIDNIFDHVVSGCVWTGDSLGSTRVASMTSGVVYINGRRHTVAAVTSRTFTASKDTYIDLLYSVVDNVATPVYTEATNNAASPALASNSVRIGIIVTGATTIAAAGSINQGQETMVLPIASSIPYAVTDSLGNLICPRDPNRKILGYRQYVGGSFVLSASQTTATQITALSCPVIVPTGRKIKVTAYGPVMFAATATDAVEVAIWDGVVVSGTQIEYGVYIATQNALNLAVPTTPATASKTYNVSLKNQSGARNITFTGGTTNPAYIMVELV